MYAYHRAKLAANQVGVKEEFDRRKQKLMGDKKNVGNDS